MKKPQFQSSMKPSVPSSHNKYFSIKISDNEVFVNEYTPENIAEIRILLRHQMPLEIYADSKEDAYAEANMLYAIMALEKIK